jgi:hypothetical protein
LANSSKKRKLVELTLEKAKNLKILIKKLLEKISPIWTQTGAGGRNEKWRKMDSSWL